MAGRPLAVRRGMGRVQPQRRQSVGAIALPQSQVASLSAAIRAAFSRSAGLSVQVDLGSGGGGTGDPSYRYVNPAASTNGNGLTWTTAFNALPATPTRGLTYWLADGNYSGRSFSTAPQGTTLITIKKATIAEHGEDNSGGWSSAMGDGQAVFTGGVGFSSAWWVFDGGRSVRWSGTSTDYGIKVVNSGQGPVVDFAAADIVFRNCDVEGNHGDGDAVGRAPNPAFQWRSGAHRTLVSRCYAHDVGQCIWFCNTNATDVIVEHCRSGLHESTGGEHSETASIWGGAARWTFRFNLITHCEGTGGLMFDGSNWFIYGNVFYREPSDSWTVGNGAVGSWTTPTEVLNQCKVFNNVFINVEGNGGGPLVGAGITIGGGVGNEARNNIFMNGKAPDFTWWAHSHNHFVNAGGTQGETGGSTGTNPFVDYANYDFRLTDAAAAAMSAGTTLAAPYNVDPDGVTRGADGKWDKGVFEKV